MIEMLIPQYHRTCVVENGETLKMILITSKDVMHLFHPVDK